DDHASALVARYHAVGTYLAQAADRLRAGVAKDRTPPAHAVDQTVRQIDEYLASPLDGDPFLAPSAPPDMEGAAAAAWREALRDAVLDTVRPAYQAFRECLADEVAPAARPSARSGVSWLPDGEAVYARAIFTGTSLRLSPDELHTAGLDAVEALGEEYRDIGGAALGTRDLAEIYGRLRDDPALRFSTSAELRTAAEQALDRAQAAVGDVVGRLPRTPCVVEEMLDHEVKDGTIAYYQPAAVDGSRPGAYYVNTWAPETRTRFEAEALAFHEAVPGHHTQIALAQELADLPAFRRHSPVNAYVEGWALYTERLADEMGLYSDDLARLGMLSFDSWRAGRLVVDTGLHALGWSRERAIAYLRDNSPLAHNNVANEVDRYIAWPGQALGYKVGQREILRLRAQARQSLGERFDLAGFHDAVLGQGPLPLGVLGDVVADWVGVVGGGGADGGLSGS
ncbi:MAG: DUF885 domain-containing protein, partial [Euzebyales bacterium]|nr:DUF885 domain-containing protein [Euzebyales bacterium]